MSATRKYRQFTVEQKAEVVRAGLRGDRSVREVCREYEISETLCSSWRVRLLEGGRSALGRPAELARPRGATSVR
ncbi:MAG: transposase [Cellulomonadaceae bacterium]|nr:transposase [Cellulomonadaceae bacterium]